MSMPMPNNARATVVQHELAHGGRRNVPLRRTVNAILLLRGGHDFPCVLNLKTNGCKKAPSRDSRGSALCENFQGTCRRVLRGLSARDITLSDSDSDSDSDDVAPKRKKPRKSRKRKKPRNSRKRHNKSVSDSDSDSDLEALRKTTKNMDNLMEILRQIEKRQREQQQQQQKPKIPPADRTSSPETQVTPKNNKKKEKNPSPLPSQILYYQDDTSVKDVLQNTRPKVFWYGPEERLMSRSVVALMRPLTFLNLAFDFSIEKESREYLHTLPNRSWRAGMPYLQVATRMSDSRTIVWSHEGRHRAIWAIRKGYDLMAVQISMSTDMWEEFSKAPRIHFSSQKMQKKQTDPGHVIQVQKLKMIRKTPSFRAELSRTSDKGIVEKLVRTTESKLKHLFEISQNMRYVYLVEGFYE